MPSEPSIASQLALIQAFLRDGSIKLISVSSGQPALVVHRAPTIDVQYRVAMIKENCAPYLLSAKWIFPHEGSVAFGPSPYVPEQ